MANTYINKVIFGDETLIDLTSDTVSTSTLLSGATAHDKSGATITGTCTYDSDTTDATVAVAEILTGKTAYARGAKLTGTMPNNGAQTGSITTKTGTVTIKQGYHDGSGTIGIATAEQNKIIAANIKEGITILGVTGTFSSTSGAKPQSRTVTPGRTGGVVLPETDKGFNYLSQVTVSDISYSLSDNSAGGQTAVIAQATTTIS